MKIVNVARHCCIRVQKQAIVLKGAGHDVHVIANRIPHMGEVYSSICYFEDLFQLENAIKFHHDADVFHCHNEPSWFVSFIKGLYPDKPVVLDMHDSYIIRVAEHTPENPRYTIDERNNSSLADAIVYVSDDMQKAVNDAYGLHDKPNTVVESRVPKHYYRVDSFKWIGGIVYEGRVDLPEAIPDGMEFFKYCDYTDTAKALKEADIPFFVYTPKQDADLIKHYNEVANWQGSYPFDTLIRKIGRHDWGLVGNVNECEAWKAAMPNKMFEYIAAGIPICAMNAPAAGKFIEDNGIGISVKNVDELKARWDEKDGCRNTLLKNRLKWTMEGQVHKLEELYAKIVDGSREGGNNLRVEAPSGGDIMDMRDTAAGI